MVTQSYLTRKLCHFNVTACGKNFAGQPNADEVLQPTFLAANPVFLSTALESLQTFNQLQPFWGQGGQSFQVRILLLEGRAFLPWSALPTFLTFAWKYDLLIFTPAQFLSLAAALAALYNRLEELDKLARRANQFLKITFNASTVRLRQKSWPHVNCTVQPLNCSPFVLPSAVVTVGVLISPAVNRIELKSASHGKPFDRQLFIKTYNRLARQLPLWHNLAFPCLELTRIKWLDK